MTIHPLASPYSAPAQPDLTGGRKIGVLLSHGFSGQPSSMTPWGEALAERGYAVEVPRLPGHGTTWQELNTLTWADWYAELTAVFDKMVAENDAVVVGGLSMGGALVLRLAADRPDQVAGVVVVNPAVATKRLDVKLLPVLKHLVKSFPGIANDIKKPGVEEHGYTRTPLKAIHSLIQAWPDLIADLPKVTAPLLYLRSTEDHVVDEASEPIITGKISSTDVTVVRLEDSYHVATIDNDAERIYKESTAFVARVTSAPSRSGAYPRGVQPNHHDDEAEDQAWRAIVENYGDRADLDDSQPPPAPPAPTAPPSAPFGGRFGDLRAFQPEDENDPFVAEDEEGYVPPEPPPLPTVEPDRMLAWVGVLGSPIVLLCALIFSIGMPPWLGYLLVAGFVGGFLYLVVKMPREPRDPWDDGAQL